MGKRIDQDLLDLALESLRDRSTVLLIRRSEPANTEELQSEMLAMRVLDSSKWIGPVDNDRGGRRISVKSQQGMKVASAGRATHVVLSDGGKVLFATMCRPVNLKRGDRVAVPRWDVEIDGPK